VIIVKKKTEENRRKFLGARIDDRLLKYINEYTSTYNISNSELIRNALRYYLKYAQKAKMNTSYVEPMIILTKRDFNFLIDKLNDEQIKDLARQDYETLLMGIKKYSRKMGIKNLDPIDFGLNNLIQTLVRDVLNYDAQNFLEHVKYAFDQKKQILTIGGTHSISKKFSKQLKYFMEFIMKPYSYELIEEIIQENRIYLKFMHKKKNSASI